MFSYRCETMDTVDGSEMTLGQLKFSGIEASDVQIFQDGGCTLELDWADYPLLEPDGDILYATFVYDAYGAAGAGWYFMQDYNRVYLQNDWPIPFGSSYAFEAVDEEPALMCAGQVVQEDLELTPEPWCFSYIGNCTPVPLKLGDLVVDGVEASDIQFFQDGGCTLELDWADYPLLDPDGDILYATFVYDAYGAAGAGWYFMQDYNRVYNMNEAAEFTMAPGQGIAFEAVDEEPKITIPTALPKPVEK